MIKNIFPIILVAISLLFVQCKREPLATTPKVTNLSDFESNDGVISIGIKGGKSPYTIEWSNKKTDTIITNLTAGTYYVTITDAKKNLFVDTIEVTQPPYPVCIDAEDNNYKTAIIGEQVWMLENLRATKTTSGSEIDALAYNNSDSISESKGLLYTWSAAMNDSVNEKAQGVCPNGWHIPSDEEWTELTDYIKTEGVEISSIFEPQYAGFYNNDFHNLDVSVSYWSSTKARSNVWKRYFHKELSTVFKYHENKENAISVRCVKD